MQGAGRASEQRLNRSVELGMALGLTCPEEGNMELPEQEDRTVKTAFEAQPTEWPMYDFAQWISLP
jgi:hypothetical protein